MDSEDEEALSQRDIDNYDRRPIMLMAQRLPSSSQQRFTGVFGIWPFPIINLLLALLQGAGSRAYPSYREPERRRRMSVWELSRDSEGRIREIIERELEDT